MVSVSLHLFAVHWTNNFYLPMLSSTLRSQLSLLSGTHKPVLWSLQCRVPVKLALNNFYASCKIPAPNLFDVSSSRCVLFSEGWKPLPRSASSYDLCSLLEESILEIHLSREKANVSLYCLLFNKGEEMSIGEDGIHRVDLANEARDRLKFTRSSWCLFNIGDDNEIRILIS